MIPLKLSFQAFGPYVKKQEIDFDKFENSGVFLIHGITGSGKTTILDAMTYALYGKSSGGQRGDITAMRCQLCKEKIPTEVEFIFKVNEKTYKFTRSINIRTKRNGTKEYTLTQNAMFLDKSGVFVPFFENPKIRDIEQKSCEIIGLNHEQFIQVIMLPQGKFEKLLVAKSEEKEEILVTLFNAEKWQEAAEWICNEARNISRDLTVKRENINMILKSENAGTIEDLDNHISELNKNIELTSGEKKEAAQLLAAEKTKLEINIDLFNLFEEKTRTENELKTIKEQENKISILSAKLDKGRKSQSIEQKYSNAMNLYGQFNEVRQRLETEKKTNAECILAKENLQNSLDELKKRESEIEKLKENKIIAEGLIQVYRQISSARISSENESKKYDLLKAEDTLNQEKLALTKDKLKKYSDKKDFIFNNYTMKLPELRERAEKFILLDKKTLELNITGLELKKAENSINMLNKDLEKNKKTVAAKMKIYDETYSRYIEQTAYIISEKLEDGKPCPVCGSIHHPQKPSKSTEDVDSALIKNMRTSLDKLSEETAELNNIIARQEANKSSKLEKYQSLENEIAEIGKSLDGFIKEDTLSELKTAETEAGKLNDLLDAIASISSEIAKLETKISELANQLSSQSKLKEETYANYNSLSIRKIDGIDDENVLMNKINNLKNEITRYTDELSALTDKSLLADKKLSSSNASLLFLKEDFEIRTKDYNTAKEEYLDLLKQNGFADTQEFKSFLTDQDTLDEWDKKIQDYIIEKKSVAKNLERLEKLTANKSKPQIENMKNIVSELETKITQLEKQSALLNERKNRLETLIKRVCEEQKLLQELIRKYDSYYSFGTTLRGDKGISLRRYVLGVMLTSVTVEANRLLKNVHGGRYQLCRTLEGSGRTRKAGLELEVFDGYSGEKRGVAGLSGGEKFLVSLALSLGLSSIVQAQSGGIKIDTMFIDEGFGSLDSSSIADAMNILGSVKGSKRLVGIISHVQLLKETIESSITVQKDRNGSTLLINN
ncbi:AAA family ATPase [Sedimentibacter sp. B4]|uniref:AAA family ATPase n=1 Tax=Sedimentibacter sp. B4 TaxID=304766 RepID=UPI0002FBF216|nr:SMC family ATPase [Sedimentibacter sp. B4]